MSRAALKAKQLILLIPALGLIGAGVFFLTGSKANPPAQSSTQQTQPAEKQNQAIAYEGEIGKTALELLKTKYQVQTKASSYGELVTSIEGREGNGPKYWAFYVNGKLADVGAGDYQTKTGDKIEWKLE